MSGSRRTTSDLSDSFSAQVRAALLTFLGPHPTWESRLTVMQWGGYTPHRAQERAHRALDAHGRTCQMITMSGGEQAGKTEWEGQEAVSWTPWSKLIWVVGPDFQQPRKEMTVIRRALARWNAIDPAKTSLPLSTSVAWVLTTRWGCEIRTLTAKELETIAGDHPDVILMVEAAQQPLEAFERCVGRITPADGLLRIGGTLEKSGRWFANKVEEWRGPNPEGGKTFHMPSWTNPHLYPGGIRDPKIRRLKQRWPADRFRERIAGLPAKPRALVLKEFERVRNVRPIRFGKPKGGDDKRTLYLPEKCRVEVWIDPGHTHAYAVLAVVVLNERIYVFDELHIRGSNDIGVIRAARTRWWWPWVAGGIMDVAGTQRTANSERTSQQAWAAPTKDGGAALKVVCRFIPFEPSLSRLRVLLHGELGDGEPQLYLDPSCKNTIWEISQGYLYPTDRDEVPISEDPIRVNDDAIAALRYGGFAHFGPLGKARRVGTTIHRALPWGPQAPRKRGTRELFERQQQQALLRDVAG